MIVADGQIVDPALPEMGHALIADRGAGLRETADRRPSIVARLGAKYGLRTATTSVDVAWHPPFQWQNTR